MTIVQTNFANFANLGPIMQRCAIQGSLGLIFVNHVTMNSVLHIYIVQHGHLSALYIQKSVFRYLYSNCMY